MKIVGLNQIVPRYDHIAKQSEMIKPIEKMAQASKNAKYQGSSDLVKMNAQKQESFSDVLGRFLDIKV